MINVAIIGAGIGREHLAGYRALPDRFKVTALCDLDTTRAAEATENDPNIRILNNTSNVMSDPDIDLIDVCLPPHLHLPTVVEALEAGKDTICEKPLARSLAEIDLIRDAIARTGRHVFPVFQYRYGMAFSQLSALMQAGLTGKAFVGSLETHWNRDAEYYAVPWRGTWEGEAGGAILGHAIHAHDLLCHVLGPVSELSAYLDTRVNDIEVDDCAAISMRLESGALATSSVTLGAGADMSRLRFCFEGLTAESGTNPYAPAKDTWRFTARGATRQSDIDHVLKNIDEPHSGFAGFLETVAEAIAGQTGREVTFEDGRRSIELVTAMYMSARDGRGVKLPIDRQDAFYEGWTSSP